MRFVFVSETNYPTVLFDPAQIAAPTFAPGFEFGLGETPMTEPW